MESFLFLYVSHSRYFNLKGTSMVIEKNNTIGCKSFKEVEFCLPALECYWCDSIGENSYGECMEFDEWINSCPDTIAAIDA